MDLNETKGLGDAYLGAGGEEIIKALDEGALIPVSVPKNIFQAPVKPNVERRLVSTHNFPKYRYFANLPREAFTTLNRIPMDSIMWDLKTEEIPLHVQTNFYFNLGEEMQYDFETNSPSHLPIVPQDLHGKSLEQLHDSPEQNTNFIIPAKNLVSTGIVLHIKEELALNISKKLTDSEQKSLLDDDENHHDDNEGAVSP